jgi:hypothetical protein
VTVTSQFDAEAGPSGPLEGRSGDGSSHNGLPVNHFSPAARLSATASDQFGSASNREAQQLSPNALQQCDDPAPVIAAKSKPASGSLRLQFTVGSADIGFEALYRELCELGNAEDRSRHVKRLLNRVCAGLSLRPTSAQHGPIATRLHNHPISFRLSGREVSLEKLYRELLALPSTFARNHRVRCWLFEAGAGLAAQPVQSDESVDAVNPSGSTSQSKQPTPSYPVAVIEAASRDDMGEAVRKAMMRKALSSIGIGEPTSEVSDSLSAPLPDSLPS